MGRRDRDPLQSLDLAGVVGHRNDVRGDAEPVAQPLLEQPGALERRSDPDVDDAGRPRVSEQARHRGTGRPELACDRLHRAVLHVVEVGRRQRTLHRLSVRHLVH